MLVLKTILVALDCSEMSEKIIAVLETLLFQPETQIIFSHVLPPPEMGEDLAADRPHQSQESLYRLVEKQLHSYQTKFPGSEVEIASGDPTEEIIRLANIYQADLILIGSRGLTGVQRIIEGSVSAQVVADAPCSVFVVKP